MFKKIFKKIIFLLVILFGVSFMMVECPMASEKLVLDFNNEKIGLSLGSGGLLGSYELGALQYLKEQGIEVTDFDSAIGTSIGSVVLSGVLSNGLEWTKDCFFNTTDEQIYNGKLTDSECEAINDIFKQKNNIGNISLIFRGVIKGQLDNQPFIDLIKNNIDEEKILNSGVEVGFCTTPVYTPTKVKCKSGSDLKGKTTDWIIASSSCYPVFPTYTVNRLKYMDGGYIDPTNAHFLFDKFNCDKIVVIDLMTYSDTYKDKENIAYICPSTDLGSFLNTDPEQILENYNQGYADMKEYFENNVVIIK